MIPEIAWWIGLFGVVGTLLALDLFVLHRDERETTFKEAAAWSALWISTAVAFGILVTLARGGQSGTEPALTSTSTAQVRVADSSVVNTRQEKGPTR